MPILSWFHFLSVHLPLFTLGMTPFRAFPVKTMHCTMTSTFTQKSIRAVVIFLILVTNNNLRYTDDPTLTAESEEELKSLLIKVKEESEKVGLKHNIQKTKIMASGPITSWQIDGETMETMTDFTWAPKSLQMVTAAVKLKGVCSLEEQL